MSRAILPASARVPPKLVKRPASAQSPPKVAAHPESPVEPVLRTRIIISSRFGRAGSSLLMTQLNNTFRAHIVGENGGALNGLCESAMEMRRTMASRRWWLCANEKRLVRLRGKTAWFNTTPATRVLNAIHTSIARVFDCLGERAHPRTRLTGFKEIRFEVAHLRELLGALRNLRVIILTREPHEHAASLLRARHLYGSHDEVAARVHQSNTEVARFAQWFPRRVLLVSFTELFKYSAHQRIARFVRQKPLTLARFRRVLKHTARQEHTVRRRAEARIAG